MHSDIATVDTLPLCATNHSLANLRSLDVASHSPGKAYPRYLMGFNSFARYLIVAQHVLYKLVSLQRSYVKYLKRNSASCRTRQRRSNSIWSFRLLFFLYKEGHNLLS